jgi:hypothetical protein
MEGTLMEYQLTITFAELGRHEDLSDRLLTLLLARMPVAGPVIASNRLSGELTIVVSVTSSSPIMDASRLSEQIGEALRDAGLQAPPTILSVRLEADREDAESLALAS